MTYTFPSRLLKFLLSPVSLSLNLSHCLIPSKLLLFFGFIQRHFRRWPAEDRSSAATSARSGAFAPRI